MKKQFLIFIINVFTFITIANAQSHAYVYISPDYGGCTGKMMIVPICIDLPQPISYNVNIAGNTFNSNGPWGVSNLCGTTLNQFLVTAIDGLGNPHTLLSGSVDLNPNSPAINYGTQSISNPLTIVHKMQPSGMMCDGSSDFEVTGGYMPYYLDLIDVNTNNSIPLLTSPPNNYLASNLCPSNYAIMIADGFSNPNCSPSLGPIGFPFTIDFFDCMITVTDVTCAGLCDGSAQLNPIGTMNISSMSIWGPSSNGVNMLNNQCQGAVMGMVLHTSGKQAMCYNQIIEPAPLNVSVTTTDCLGYGTNDGTATANVTGGTMPYSYSWNTGDSLVSINNLSPGQYCVLVIDYNGCDTTVCENVTQPPQLIITITNITHQTSTTPNGSVSFNITGGVVPYISSLIRYNNNDTIPGPFTYLAAGNYAIYVVDGNGITATQPFTINNTTSINENEFNYVKVYPNPANQLLWVEAENIETIEVYHISGKLVLQQQLDNQTKVSLNITDLSSGSYYIRILNRNNQKVVSFIKQ